MVDERVLRRTSEGSTLDRTQTGDRYFKVKRWYLNDDLWPPACLLFILQSFSLLPRSYVHLLYSMIYRVIPKINYDTRDSLRIILFSHRSPRLLGTSGRKVQTLTHGRDVSLFYTYFCRSRDRTRGFPKALLEDTEGSCNVSASTVQNSRKSLFV